MKFEFMMRILFELLTKKSVTAKYLAEKFDVCVRTIYRYIDALELAGVPIYTNKGNSGGISIVDTYKLSSTFFTHEEYEKIISSLNAINENVHNSVLDSAILKLKSSKRNEYSGFDVKSGNLIIDGGPWGDTNGYKSKLLILEKSIENCNQLLITYHDRNGKTTERTIEPHIMVFKQGIWYTYAYCTMRKTFRFFKTGRIEKATILNSKFTRHDISKMDLPLDFWHNSVETEYIEMEVKKSCRSDIEEWLGIENIEEIKGKIIAHANLPFDDGLVYKIMSYGDGVKVLSPENLKEKIKTVTNNIIKQYE